MQRHNPASVHSVVRQIGAEVVVKKAIDGPRLELIYQIDWPASIRRVDERTFEHIVAGDCVLSQFIRDALGQTSSLKPAHRLKAEFPSSGRVTALLSEEGHLYQARFPSTWVCVRMIGHEPLELFRLSLKRGDPDPELLEAWLRSVGATQDVIEHLKALESRRTMEGRPPANRGELQIKNWIMLLEVLAGSGVAKRVPRPANWWRPYMAWHQVR